MEMILAKQPVNQKQINDDPFWVWAWRSLYVHQSLMSLLNLAL